MDLMEDWLFRDTDLQTARISDPDTVSPTPRGQEQATAKGSGKNTSMTAATSTVTSARGSGESEPLRHEEFMPQQPMIKDPQANHDDSLGMQRKRKSAEVHPDQPHHKHGKR